MKQGILVLIFLTFASISFAQSTRSNNKDNNTSVSPQIKDPNQFLIEYTTFLREESKAHREFLERYYTFTAAIFAAIGVAFGGLLTWLNWKTKQDIRAQVNEQFKQRVETIVDERISQFDTYLSELKLKFENQVKGINKILLDLSQQAQSAPTVELQDATQGPIGKTVLWVDDFPHNNDYPRTILEEAGVKFELALSTEEALASYMKNKFDLIISDMGRGTNYTAGLDLLRELKSMKSETPVIIYASSRGISEHGQTAIQMGAIAVTNGTTNLLREVLHTFTKKR